MGNKILFACFLVLAILGACALTTGLALVDSSQQGMKLAELESGGSIELIDGAKNLEFELEQQDGKIGLSMSDQDEAYLDNVRAHGYKFWGATITGVGGALGLVSLLFLYHAITYQDPTEVDVKKD